MNDRIKQIAADCGLYIAYDNREVTDKELKHFAEMIIHECLDCIESDDSYDYESYDEWLRGHTAGLRKAKDLIVNHFEVEE